MLEATHEFLDLFFFLYGGCAVDANGDFDPSTIVSECYDEETGKKLHHVPIINMDWSSNHAAKADNCLTSLNFRRSWGYRYFQGTNDKKPSPRGDNDDGSSTLVAGDLNPDAVQRTGGATYPLKAGEKQFYTFQEGDGPPFADPTAVDFVGQDKGYDQVLYERGYDVSNMTIDGHSKIKTKNKTKAQKKKEQRRKEKEEQQEQERQEQEVKFNVGELVVVIFAEPLDGGGTEDVRYLYRVIGVDKDHKSVQDDKAIRVERMRKQFYDGDGAPEGGTHDFYCNDALDKQNIPANLIGYVHYQNDPDFKLVYGKLDGLRRKRNSGNNFICVIDFDATEYLDPHGDAVEAESDDEEEIEGNDEENEENDEENEENEENDEQQQQQQQQPTTHASGRKKKNTIVIADSLKSVFVNSPSVKNAKSLIQKLVEKRGGVLIMSARFHPECAGVGIEYCFGRSKWYYKRNHVHSTKGLKVGSERCFDKTVVTLHHARRFGRKNRDYMRAYRAGSMGLRTNDKVKVARTHRSALDTDYNFVGQPAGEVGVDYGDTTNVLNHTGKYYDDVAEDDAEEEE